MVMTNSITTNMKITDTTTTTTTTTITAVAPAADRTHTKI